MSVLNWLMSGLESLLAKIPASTVATVGTTNITWSGLELSTQSVGTFLAAMSASIKAKNIETGVEVSIEEAVTLAADLGFGEPFTGILKTVLPLMFDAMNDPKKAAALVSNLAGSINDNAGEQQSQIIADRFGR